MREKSDRFLLMSLIISSVTLVLSFISFILFLFFYIIVFVTGHQGEANWTIAVAVVSFCVFFFSTFYFAVVDKIRKERARAIK